MFFTFESQYFCNELTGRPSIPEHFDHPLLRHMESLLVDPSRREIHEREKGNFTGINILRTDIGRACRAEGNGVDDCVPKDLWEPRCQTGGHSFLFS